MDGSGPASIPENIPREISGLDPASWLVLWGIRYWACCYRSNRSSWPMLNDLFEQNRIASATFSLNGLMRISALTTRRSLDIRCPACSGISGDERMVLDAIRYAQRGEVQAARAILRDWLPETAARMATHMVMGLAEILSQGGFRLRPIEAQIYAWPGKQGETATETDQPAVRSIVN